ncbi:DUF2514 family protein [Serratia odorifera]|uniref:DUF2514 domain-containing protein n=1 Tax=Serratia odorifera DSM 4582 TaxID=667129 RepID=D4DZ53_SEROD|nr:DUF2514 family protein [Serratia odorifera]EFE97111.1 hypothetical protein HMPREF0758_1203 [Serratia odorifera DSM 4582]PNK91669.1 DUF2514 domain-containing protein [Serratia odorifera]RII72747.1 DUF2514 family protein [Serratia odorifera]
MILGWLKRHWRGLLVTLILGSAFLSGSWFGARQANTTWALKWKQRDADDATALAKRQARARAEEQRRQGEIDAIEKRAEGQIAEAVADADRARAVADGLHGEAAKLAARLAASERARRAATASGSATGTTGSELLAELFRRADQRAGELAAIADQARIRGLTCEAAYNSIGKEK